MRNDIHSPKHFLIADYTVVDYFGVVGTPDRGDGESDYESYGDEAREAYFAQEDGGADNPHPDLTQCDLCGARFVNGAVLIHNPTGRLISIGGQCMTSIAGLRGLTKGQRFARARADKRQRERVGNLKAFVRLHRGISKVLRCTHYISKDLREQLISKGSLSEKQVALAYKLLTQEAERAAVEPTWVAVPQTSKREQVTAVILGTKEQPGYAYNSFVTKMLVQVDAGDGKAFKLWGSLPSAIDDLLWGARNAAQEAIQPAIDAVIARLQADGEESAKIQSAIDALRVSAPEPKIKGTKIRFSAKFEPSKGDELFGFFQRPTKVEVLSWGK